MYANMRDAGELYRRYRGYVFPQTEICPMEGEAIRSTVVWERRLKKKVRRVTAPHQKQRV
jgi:hypothetical protein